ncbi:MAG TPA: DNA internalization-related competence protein ComEC/Rec2, partial [Thermoanaerobacterales bacterium]|nr:DNA internalization-related competence protein ComEC/Rec2 [Thermoanaerobacterales bacterium]
AALVILIINPLSLFMPGFQLSFGATLGIIVLFPRIRKTFYFLPKGIADLVCVTISAQLGILPLLIYYFGEISIICILTNVLILPLIGVIIILGFVSIITAFILPQIGSIIGAVNSLLIKLIINSSLFFSRLPYSTISIKTPSILLIITYYLFLYSLIKRNKKAFTLLTLLIVIIIWHPIVIGGVSGLEVTFIDVGQGDAIFIKTPKGKNIMIDSGGLPDYYLGDFDIGTDVILPFLRYKGVRKLDMIFISHIHDDHIKGFIPVLDEISVDYFVQAPQKVLTPNYKLLIDKLKKYNIPVISVSKGDYITLEKDLELYVLHPDLEWISRDPFDFNNNSLVIMMKYKNTTFLFTGDIESAAESKIADDFRLQLKSDVLKVAHHGSNTSSIDSLIENIQPSIAIISVGRNTFGHPHNDVINRIKALGVDIFRTDVDGAVTIKTNGYKIKCNTTIKN